MAKPQMQYPLPAKPALNKPEVPKAEVKAEPAAQTPKTIKVFAKYGRFVDLVKDVIILSEPVEVEHHDWLQAQIDAGLLIKA